MSLRALALDLLIDAATAGGEWVIDKVRGALRKKPEPEPHPTWKDIEHRRAQEKSAIAHKVKP